MSIELIFNDPYDFREVASDLRGKWVMITDNDGENHEGWLDLHAKGLELEQDEDSDGVTVTVIVEWDQIGVVNV